MIAFPLLLATSITMATPNQALINKKPRVIPTIREWHGGSGYLTIQLGARVCLEKPSARTLKPVAEVIVEDLKEIAGFEAPIVVDEPKAGDICLKIDDSLDRIGSEGYRLNVDEHATILARTATGTFYGTRTLLQMLVLDPRRRIIAKGEIVDWPNYPVRGFMLDVGRKFFPAKYLNQYVKFMGWYKMNDFQLHLNDNPGIGRDWKTSYSGFRLQSKKFPGLTSKDGSYSRSQIQWLQKLAAKHGVNITPELDAPAHALALTQFRPELTSEKLPKDHLDLTNPQSIEFVKQIWDEFIPWFTSPHVHIGADEYASDKDSHKYYKQYINEVCAFIKSRGKTVRMWGGLRTGGGPEGVDRDIVVNLWYPGYHDPIDAVNEGYKIINTHDGYLYIVPFAGYYYHWLNTEYLYGNWKPTVFSDDKRFNDDDPNVLGGMFCVWNDRACYPFVFEDVHELVQPAMPTLAEKLWSGQPVDRDYKTFASDFKVLGDGPGVHIGKPPVFHRKGNLAFGKSGSASDRQNGEFGVNKLFDGRPPSRWFADANKPQWVSVDLGSVQPISRVLLRWAFEAFASEYCVSTSIDGTNWVQVQAKTDGDGGVETVRFVKTEARYVRIDMSKRGGREGQFSLFELEVYR